MYKFVLLPVLAWEMCVQICTPPNFAFCLGAERSVYKFVLLPKLAQGIGIQICTPSNLADFT